MHTNYKILKTIKMVKIIKAAPSFFGSHRTIIREPFPVLSQNYISGTNVRVVIDVVSVLAAFMLPKHSQHL